jgi:hypothetical protein
VDERARQRNLGSLSLRKPLRTAIGKRIDLEQLNDLVYAVIDFRPVEAAEPGEISDILAGGKMGIKTRAVRQGSNLSPGGETVRDNIGAVDGCVAFVRLQYRVEDP